MTITFPHRARPATPCVRSPKIPMDRCDNQWFAFAARNGRPGGPAGCKNVAKIISLSPIGTQSKWLKWGGALGISTRSPTSSPVQHHMLLGCGGPRADPFASR